MKFTVKESHERRHTLPKVSTYIEEDNLLPSRSIGDELFQTRYLLELKVATEFWSNKAQLEKKTAHAEKLARSFLFKDILVLIDQIINESDNEEVWRLANQVRKQIIGDS